MMCCRIVPRNLYNSINQCHPNKFNSRKDGIALYTFIFKIFLLLCVNFNVLYNKVEMMVHRKSVVHFQMVLFFNSDFVVE